METIILAFILLALVMTAMAVGVIVKGKPIKGSCGGIAAIGMGTACDICGGDSQKCEKEKKKQSSGSEAATASFYDASKQG